MKKFNSIQTDLIELIIGQKELLELKEADLSKFVLISIQDPDDLVDLSHIHNKFKKHLHIRFWDIEEDIGVKSNGFDIKPLSNEDGRKISDFILENRNEKFIIHCFAGQSRSAAVGLALECLLKFNGSKKAMNNFSSSILSHNRYDPNPVVFDKIIENTDKKKLNLFSFECPNCEFQFNNPIASLKNGKEFSLCPDCFKELEE